MIEGMHDPDDERVHAGLKLLGWRADSRYTSEDIAQLAPTVERALSLHGAGGLTPDLIDELSLKVYKFISFQLMNPTDRAMHISSAYSRSRWLSPLVSLIDQATCCYYHRYYTASLATMFIVTEGYLRNLLEWAPGQTDPSFKQLKSAVAKLPECRSRDEASVVLQVIYARYNANDPPQFYFNRHGLLHGIRTDMQDLDAMNCVRLYLLLDLLCEAEGVETDYIFTGPDDVFYKREKMYRECL